MGLVYSVYKMKVGEIEFEAHLFSLFHLFSFLFFFIFILSYLFIFYFFFYFFFIKKNFFLIFLGGGGGGVLRIYMKNDMQISQHSNGIDIAGWLRSIIACFVLS